MLNLNKLPIIRTINIFPKKTKIALWLLIISFGIVVLLLFLLLTHILSGAHISGPDSLFLLFILPFLYFSSLLLLLSIFCFLMRKEWAWQLGMKSLGIVLLPSSGLFLLSFFLGIFFIFSPFVYLFLFLLVSFILLILDKKNFEKIIIPEGEKSGYLIVIKIIKIILLISALYLILPYLILLI